MQYNESQYNGDSYNLTNYTSTLVETIAPIDATVSKSISSLRVESQATSDTIGGSDTLQAFLETITILQRARTPFAYNTGMYNQYMYNARLDEDEILLMATKALSDTITSSDTVGAFSVIRLLIDTIIDTDTVFFGAETFLQESVFLDEFARVEVSNKALNETIRTADWLTIDRRPVNQEWGD